MMKMFRKRDEGFTLIELMVVVLIIGILVAIAIPVFNAARRNAWQRSCFANQRTIEGSAQTYQAENDVLPATVGTMVPTYIKNDPKCPRPGSSSSGGYSFVSPNDGTVSSCSGGTDAPTVHHGHFTHPGTL